MFQWFCSLGGAKVKSDGKNERTVIFYGPDPVRTFQIQALSKIVLKCKAQVINKIQFFNHSNAAILYHKLGPNLVQILNFWSDLRTGSNSMLISGLIEERKANIHWKRSHSSCAFQFLPTEYLSLNGISCCAGPRASIPLLPGPDWHRYVAAEQQRTFSQLPSKPTAWLPRQGSLCLPVHRRPTSVSLH